MAWDRRGYYYRSRKVGGKVRREYIGRGPLVLEFANLEQQHREIIREQKLRRTLQLKTEAENDERFSQYLSDTETLLEAIYLALGYRKHNRGEWRKRREHA